MVYYFMIIYLMLMKILEFIDVIILMYHLYLLQNLFNVSIFIIYYYFIIDENMKIKIKMKIEEGL